MGKGSNLIRRETQGLKAGTEVKTANFTYQPLILKEKLPISRSKESTQSSEASLIHLLLLTTFLNQ